MTFDTSKALSPHAGEPVLVASPVPQEPRSAVILLHGRGAGARDILGLTPMLRAKTDATLFIAPHGALSSWYPQSFLAPMHLNQAGIDSAHSVIEMLIASLRERGITADRVALLGFSQGACLTLDHAAKHPRRYGALIAFTGGIIGPEGTVFPTSGTLDGTPTFIGANDPDPHVPWSRVEASARHLESMGAAVTLKRYPGEPHSVNADEIEHAKRLIAQMSA